MAHLWLHIIWKEVSRFKRRYDRRGWLLWMTIRSKRLEFFLCPISEAVVSAGLAEFWTEIITNCIYSGNTYFKPPDAIYWLHNHKKLSFEQVKNCVDCSSCYDYCEWWNQAREHWRMKTALLSLDLYFCSSRKEKTLIFCHKKLFLTIYCGNTT